MHKAGHTARCCWWYQATISGNAITLQKTFFYTFFALTLSRSERCATIDAVQAGILDHVYSKTEALRLAVDAAVTVLRVDQISMYVSASLLYVCVLHGLCIIQVSSCARASASHESSRAKQAGGPKAPAMGGGD